MWPWTLEIVQSDGSGPEPDGPEPDGPGPPSSGPPPKRGIRKRPAFEQGVNWLKRQIARVTDLENVKQGIVGREEDRLRRRLFRLFGRQVFLRLLKMRILTPYKLRIPYLIVAGDGDALRVTDAEPIENTYTWNAETEIHREEVGSRPVAVAGGDPHRYALNTFGFKRISLTTELDPAFGTSNPIQWGTGMHMLAWDAAVRDIRPEGDRVTGTLDLFYKSWSEAMNEVLTLTTWGAVRSAGRATLGARLSLLQFKEAAPGGQRVVPGRIHWPGGGLNAQDHPRARCERTLTGENGADCGA
jgi:hypothetical protein